MSSEAYDSLNRIYDRGERRVKNLLRADLSREDRDTIDTLARSFSENVAKLVVNYAAQVFNGGHEQYASNCYLKHEGEDLMTVLRLINSPSSNKVLDLVEELCAGCPDGEPPEYDEEDCDQFGHLDTIFYDLDGVFLSEVLDWIRAKDIETAKALMETMDEPGEETQWYVKDDEGKMHGPYDDRSDAECDADRIDGLVVPG